MKNKIVAIISCTLILCLAAMSLVGCGPKKEDIVGTWDLTSCEPSGKTEGAIGLVYTEDQVKELQEANQEFYVTFFDSGLVIFNQLGAISNGKWELKGSELKLVMDMPGSIDPETGNPVHEVTLTGKLNGKKLDITNPNDNTLYHFAKADETKNPYDANENIVVANEDGLSLLMTEGEKMPEIKIVDDKVATIVLDGKGVDNLGDPGFNMKITNNSTSTINVWIPEQVRVGESSADAYMYITLYPTNSTTTFMQLNYEDLGLAAGNTNYDMLTDVSGTIQINNANTGDVLGTYEFSVSE